MYKNIEEFNLAYNSLHHAIANKLNKSKKMSFKKLIGLAQTQNDKVISNYYEKLKFYNEFRNNITHDRSLTQEPYALPTDYLIDEMKVITQSIEYPTTVIDLFKTKVLSFNIHDSLADVLKAVEKNNYSQFPVFDDEELVGMITENGITNFLADKLEDDIISIKETSIKEVLRNDENFRSYDVINPNKSIYDIESMFDKRIREGNTTYFLLISTNKKAKDKSSIQGIVTPWDIPKIVKNK